MFIDAINLNSSQVLYSLVNMVFVTCFIFFSDFIICCCLAAVLRFFLILIIIFLLFNIIHLLLYIYIYIINGVQIGMTHF